MTNSDTARDKMADAAREADRCRSRTWTGFGHAVCNAVRVNGACPVSPFHTEPAPDYYFPDYTPGSA